MRRYLISFCGGMAITISPALIGAIILNREIGLSFIALLLYGPVMLMEKLGLGPDCANANSVAEKLNCVRLGIIIDLFAYPLIISASSYLIYIILFRRTRRLRLP